MPLVQYSVEILLDLLRNVRKRTDRPRVLTLSCPDLIIAREKLVKLCRGIPLDEKKLKISKDSDAIRNWHKALHRVSEVVDTASFFDAIGCEYQAVDMTAGRGCEILHNLDHPVPDGLLSGTYDVVFDCITNQCFNVAQAMKTAWDAVSITGYCFHVIPAQMINQGFWSVSPTAYHDFYAANCGRVLRLDHIVGVYEKISSEKLDTTRRVRGALDDTMNIVVAQKIEQVPTRWPIMTKFQQHPTCLK